MKIMKNYKPRGYIVSVTLTWGLGDFELPGVEIVNVEGSTGIVVFLSEMIKLYRDDRKQNNVTLIVLQV